MVADIPENVERWTAKRRVALVVSILKGETSAAEAARKHALTVAEVEDWRDRFLLGAENALRSRPKDEEPQASRHDAQRAEEPPVKQPQRRRAGPSETGDHDDHTSTTLAGHQLGGELPGEG